MYDLTNQYVSEGVRGGLLALTLFVASLCCAFSGVGRICRLPSIPPDRRILTWGLGASLFVHVIIFLGVSISYSQQSLMVFYFVLAVIGSLASASQAHTSVQPRISRPAKAV